MSETDLGLGFARKALDLQDKDQLVQDLCKTKTKHEILLRACILFSRFLFTSQVS